MYDFNCLQINIKSIYVSEEKPKTKQLTFADSDDDDDDGNIFSIEKKAEITEDKKQRKTSETKVFPISLLFPYCFGS